ncbi:MAG: cytochrome b/b6 domain-containing protein [Burkholderiaceae bacterium]
MPTALRVWDLPTRLFHWLLAACVIGLVVTGKIGGNAMVWHARLGYAVGALLVFRFAWGFVGGRWSRFGAFLYSPRSTLAYLRGRAHPDHLIGHNPLGALSVFALLAILAVQVGTGLISDDEIAFTGPLNRFVASAIGLAATGWHKGYGQWIIISLVVLHVAAILFYVLVKRETLVRPMITGDKEASSGTPPSDDGAGKRVLGALLFAACAGLAWWVTTLGA